MKERKIERKRERKRDRERQRERTRERDRETTPPPRRDEVSLVLLSIFTEAHHLITWGSADKRSSN